MLITIIILILIIFSIIIEYTEYFEPNLVIDPLLKKADFKYSFKTLFKDVVTYPNDESYTMTPSFQTGIRKCRKNCKGTCMELGLTGIGYCFPPYT